MYPYRLVSADKITDRIRDVTQELITDSGIGDETVTNEYVISKAIEYDAQYIVPKDYLNDISRTHESIKEFLELYQASDCTSTIIIPIQPPHEKHYKYDEQFYQQFSHYAVGGVKEAKTQEQIQAVENLRKEVGDYKWLHGLGMGCSEEMIYALRTKSPFLDSLDTSTFERMPGQYNKIAGSDWIQHELEFPSSENDDSEATDITTLQGIIAEWHAYLANYQLTDFAPPLEDNIDTTQATLQEM